MDERYKLLQNKQVRNIEGFNKAVEASERLPYWLVVIDELADLMLVSSGDVQTALVRLPQNAPAGGLPLLVAPQRPSVEDRPRPTKANIPTTDRVPLGSQRER